MYIGECKITSQLTGSLIDTKLTSKQHNSKQGALLDIKRKMSLYSDSYFGSIYTNYDYSIKQV